MKYDGKMMMPTHRDPVQDLKMRIQQINRMLVPYKLLFHILILNLVKEIIYFMRVIPQRKVVSV